VTPPGGPRDDDADRAPRRVAAPGSAPDAPSAGEPGSDPQLRAMRSVWLAMRDEDPPDRGLAGLLAAARHQAAAMQPRPSAWQRLLAALRRPPVLALATVTVLIAGAVLIGRRVPREAAPGPISSQETIDAARPAPIDPGAGAPGGAPAAGSAAAGTYRTGQAAAHGAAPATPVPQAAAPPPAPAASPARGSVRPEPRAHRAKTPAIASPGEAARHDDDRAAAGPITGLPPPAADPAPAPATAPSERAAELGASAAVPSADTTAGNSTRLAVPRGDPQTSQPAGGAASNAASAPASKAAKNAASPVASGVAVPARRPAPAPPREAAGDLSRQCEAAAQRGDCATVRRLVDRITRTDRSYRARLVKDSPVGRCLVE
jgi:Meckel syndrome type 1 protein